MGTIGKIAFGAWTILSAPITLLARNIDGNRSQNNDLGNISNKFNHLDIDGNNFHTTNNANLSRFLEEIGVNQTQQEQFKTLDLESTENHTEDDLNARILEILDDKKKLDGIKAHLSEAHTTLKEVKAFDKAWEGKVNIDGDGGKARDLSTKIDNINNNIGELSSKYSGSSENERMLLSKKLEANFIDQMSLSIKDLFRNINNSPLKHKELQEKIATLQIQKQIATKEINIQIINLKAKNSDKIYKNLTTEEQEVYRNTQKKFSAAEKERSNIVKPLLEDIEQQKIELTNLTEEAILNKFFNRDDSNADIFRGYSPTNINQCANTTDHRGHIISINLINNFIITKIKNLKSKIDTADKNMGFGVNIHSYSNKDDLLVFVKKYLDTSVPELDDSVKFKEIINDVMKIRIDQKPKGSASISREEMVELLQQTLDQNDLIKHNFLSPLFNFASVCGDNNFKHFEQKFTDAMEDKDNIQSLVLSLIYWNPGNILLAPPDDKRITCGQEGDVYPCSDIETRGLLALKEKYFTVIKKIIYKIDAQSRLNTEGVIVKPELSNDRTIEIQKPIDEKYNTLAAFFDDWKDLCKKSKAQFLTKNDFEQDIDWVNVNGQCDLNYLAEIQG